MVEILPTIDEDSSDVLLKRQRNDGPSGSSSLDGLAAWLDGWAAGRSVPPASWRWMMRGEQTELRSIAEVAISDVCLHSATDRRRPNRLALTLCIVAVSTSQQGDIQPKRTGINLKKPEGLE